MKRSIFILTLMFATSIYGQQFPAPYLNAEAQMLTHDPDMAQTWELAWCYAGFECGGNWNLMTYELNKQAHAIVLLSALMGTNDFSQSLLSKAVNKFAIRKANGSLYAVNFRGVYRYYKHHIRRENRNH